MSTPESCPYCSRIFFWGSDADSALVEAQGETWKSCRENAHWKLTFHITTDHPDSGFRCPRRGESPSGHLPGNDWWRPDGHRCCSYCGSMSPADLFKEIEAVIEIGPTDKSYKIYVGGKGKFYFQHLSNDEQRRFIDLYNAGKIKMGLPGYFYVLPFFCTQTAVRSSDQPLAPAADRTQRILTTGAPVPEDDSHTELRPDGQQKGYVVLTEAERAKGFVEPVRTRYRHVGPPAPKGLRDLTRAEHERYERFGYVKYEPYGPERAPVLGKFWTQDMLDRLDKGCGHVTSMGRSIAETYARDPGFYGATFCTPCGKHFPVGAEGEFVWDDTDQRVGTRSTPSTQA